MMIGSSGRRRLAGPMRWTGRIICLLITLFGGIMLIGEAVVDISSEGFGEISAAGILLVVIGLIALAGCILSWWKELLSSVLLLITSAGLGLHIGIFAGRNHFLVWSMLGGPYLVAGLLLFLAWRLSRFNEGQVDYLPQKK